VSLLLNYAAQEKPARAIKAKYSNAETSIKYRALNASRAA
jgi:hypothetical protein